MGGEPIADGGCGCVTAGGSTNSQAGPLVLLLGALGLTLTRRRRAA
ncbi:MYXO-CTERM sorting domain-containing protein [Sorangium cellulosum]